MSSPPPGNPPSAEVVIDDDLVATLLADQHPDLADLPLRRAAEGWDNITYRLGPEMAVRLPRRLMAARLIEHEQRWLPQISRHVSLPIPSPIRCGAPSADYPWS